MLKKGLVFILFMCLSFIGVQQVYALPSACDLSPTACIEDEDTSGSDVINLESSFTKDVNGDYTSIDINGEEFYSGEYSVAEWEYDYNQLNEFSERGSISVNSLMLPTLKSDNMPDDYTYLVYKTQIVKYDPVLYDHIEYALGIYDLSVQDAIKWNEIVIDNTVDELVVYTFSLVGVEIDSPPETVGDYLNILTQIGVNESCKIGDDIPDGVAKETLEYVCDYAKSELQSSNGNQYLKDVDYFEIIPDEYQTQTTRSVFDYIVSKLRENPQTDALLKAAKASFIVTDYLVMLITIYQANQNIEMYNNVSKHLEMLVPMFKDEFAEKDIRIDYTIRSDYMITLYTDDDLTTSEDGRMFNVDTLSYDFDSWSTHIFFSSTEVDKLQKTMYPSEYNTSSLYYGIGGISGTLKVYSSSEFMDELDDYLFSKLNLIAAVPVGTWNVTTYNTMQNSGYEFDTPEFNLYTSHQNITNQPELDVANLVESVDHTSVTLSVNHDNYNDNLIKSKLYVYDETGLVYERELDLIESLNIDITISELQDSTPYYVKVLTYYYDIYSKQTLIEMSDAIFITITYLPELVDDTIVDYVTPTSIGFDVDVNDLYNSYSSMNMIVCEGEYDTDSEPCIENRIFDDTWTLESKNINVLGLNNNTNYSYFLSFDYLNINTGEIQKGIIQSGGFRTLLDDPTRPTVVMSLTGVSDTVLRIATNLSTYNTNEYGYMDYQKLQIEVFNESGTRIENYFALKEYTLREINYLSEGNEYTVRVTIRYFDKSINKYVYEYAVIDSESTLYNGGGSIGGPIFFE